MTNLLIHPITLMDVSMKDYLKMQPADALELINKLSAKLKEVDGIFVSLWHNESFDYKYSWKGWENVYESLLEIAGKE